MSEVSSFQELDTAITDSGASSGSMRCRMRSMVSCTSPWAQCASPQTKAEGIVQSTVTSLEKAMRRELVEEDLSCLCLRPIMLFPIVPHSKDSRKASVWACHSVQNDGSSKKEWVHFNTKAAASPARGSSPRHLHLEVAWCRAKQKAPSVSPQVYQKHRRVLPTELSWPPAPPHVCFPQLRKAPVMNW